MPAPKAKPYPDVEADPSFAAIEERVLAYWRANKVFERSVEQRPAGPKGDNEYVFYDGPPFANGLPHYGHLLTGYVKDIVPRYQTMRGRRVERRFGWDCHGLPAEMEAEKELGVSGRKRDRRVRHRPLQRLLPHFVLRYTEAWQETVTRQARWVDFKHDYKTMDLSYMESVMWAFKQLWDKGLLYEGYRVMPYSWAAQTPLSNFETRLDNSYRERQDPAITVRFALAGGRRRSAGLDDDAVDPALEPGARRRAGDRVRAVREGREAHRARRGHRREVRARSSKARGASAACSGAELVGRRYTPLFPFFAKTPNAFRVLAGDVRRHRRGHRRRAHGAGLRRGRHGRVCRPPASRWSCPSTRRGSFTSEVPPWAGQLVFDANKDDHPRPEGARRARPPRDDRPQLPALLAHRPAADLPRDELLVREGHRDPRPHGRAATSRSTGCRSTSATACSASGSRARATGRSAATASGARRIPVWTLATTRASRASTSTARSTSSSATSACGRTTCTAPRSTGSCAPTPTTRAARRRCAASPTCSTAGSSRARCPTRRCTTRSRTASGSRTTSRPTSSSSTSPRRAAGSTRMHVLATALFDRHAVPELHLPRRGARRERAEALEAPAQLPEPRGSVRELRRRRAALVPVQLADPARRATCRSTARASASARSCGWCCARSGTPTTSSVCTRTRTACARASAATPPGVLDRYILAKTRRPRARRRDRARRLRHPGRLQRGRELHRRAQQLVHPAQPRPLLGRGRKPRQGAMRTTRSTRCSSRRCARRARSCRCCRRRSIAA